MRGQPQGNYVQKNAEKKEKRCFLQLNKKMFPACILGGVIFYAKNGAIPYK
jgi:hypothetical protein